MTIMEHVNGRAKGRAAPPLPEYTFQDSGITVRLRKLSPMLLDDIDNELRRRHPAPPIPVVETELGKEANDADPDYQRAYARWQIEHAERLGEEWLQAIVELAIECDVDLAAVARVRAYAARRNITLDGDDKFIYVRHVCITTREEIAELRDAVSRRTFPTREAVESHKETFRSDVSGPADLQLSAGAEERD